MPSYQELIDLFYQYQSNVPIWGFAAVFSFCLILVLSLEKAKRKGVLGDDIFGLVSVTALGGLLGARIGYLYVYQANIDFVSTLSWGEVFYKGHLNIVGGYLGAVITGWFYLQGFAVLQRSKMTWLRFFDTFLYIIPLGLAFGYIGVFLVSISKGAITNQAYPWVFPMNGYYIHPWGLYIAAGYLFLFMILFILNQRLYEFRRPGYLTSVLVLGIASIHFLADFWQNTDFLYGDPRIIGLTITQWVSLIVIFITGLTLLFRRARNREKV
jgi:phosphatidylglycerol:prolipoprotein diacylglycerol transferase